MAGKISELADLVDPAPSDLVEVVDVSDVSMAPTGTNKRVSFSRLSKATSVVPVYGRVPGTTARGPFFTTNAAVVGEGYRWFHPLPSFPGEIIISLVVYVATAGSAGAVVRLALYADDGAGQPGALLRDAGTVATDTIGEKTASLPTSYTVPGGIGQVWASCHPDNAATTKAILTHASNIAVPWYAYGSSSMSHTMVYSTGTSRGAGYRSTVLAVDAAAPNPAPALVADRYCPAVGYWIA